MATSNVFVIPAAHVQQQPGVGLGNPLDFNLNHNYFDTLLNGLGLFMNPSNGCGRAPRGLADGFPLNNSGTGVGSPIMHTGPNFSCRGCNFQM